MASYVVYLDQHHAKIWKFLPGKREQSELRAEGDGSSNHSHQKHAHGNHVAHPDTHTTQFFHALALKLRDATELLLLGPGEGKAQFKHHLEKHHHAELARSIVGIEPMDRATDNEILAHARKFFRAHDLFTGEF
jgi:uncharacterized protein